MSNKYTTTKCIHSIDILKISDNNSCSIFPLNVYKDMGSTYQEYDDEVKSGAKKEGDVKVAAKGWQEEVVDIDAELTRVFGEVDADVKSEITSHFTDTLKSDYITWVKESKGF